MQVFTRSILRSQLEADYDEQLAFQLVTFIMDNHEVVLNVPDDLKVQVEDRLTALKKTQVRIVAGTTLYSYNRVYG